MSLKNPHASWPAGREPISAGQVLPAQATTQASTVLGRICQSLAEFTILTDHLRQAVDERLGARLSVTGWQEGILRVHLDQPALATRWRFQEPAVRRALLRVPALAGLKEIRLTIAAINRLAPPASPPAPSRLDAVPAEAIDELASTESHERLRQALTTLAEAAAKARQGGNPFCG